KLNVTRPGSVYISTTDNCDDKWTGDLAAGRCRWRCLYKTEVRDSGLPALGQALGFSNIAEDREWRDTWS
ncbi:transporter, partial [Pseudomonas aeruginosa]